MHHVSACNTTVKGVHRWREERREIIEPRDERDEHIMQASCLAEQASRSMPRCTTTVADTRLRELSLEPATSSLIISPRGEHGSLSRFFVHAKANQRRRFKSGLIFDGFGGRKISSQDYWNRYPRIDRLWRKIGIFILGRSLCIFSNIFDYPANDYLLFVWCKVCAPNRIVKYSNHSSFVKFSGMMRFN